MKKVQAVLFSASAGPLTALKGRGAAGDAPRQFGPDKAHGTVYKRSVIDSANPDFKSGLQFSEE
ncbi:MAG: hypothetical protein CMJ81_13125 [Planctomycetaceae bacterium]|nr:hypothetical protein [Planctomycetaceae bacterium]MBP60598.1 hypothetical protein [Planctomycetaceae bacterium]